MKEFKPKSINITIENNMEELVDDFLLYYTNLNSSMATVKNYQVDLKQFNNWLSNKDFKYFDELEIKDFEEFIFQFKPATAKRKCSSIRMFYKYLQREEIILENKVLNAVTPKKQKVQPDIISEEETRNIILAMKNEYEKQKDIASFRNYLIIELFLSTGIRREELTHISLSDVNFSENKILINGKGNKQRLVFPNSQVMNDLKLYTEQNNSKNCEFILFNFSTAYINTIVNKAMELAGCKKKGRSCHTLRKRFASTSYKQTGDIYAVSKALGHEDLETIKFYAEAEQEKIRNAFSCISY